MCMFDKKWFPCSNIELCILIYVPEGRAEMINPNKMTVRILKYWPVLSNMNVFLSNIVDVRINRRK